jgi:hypothetical protein
MTRMIGTRDTEAAVSDAGTTPAGTSRGNI